MQTTDWTGAERNYLMAPSILDLKVELDSTTDGLSIARTKTTMEPHYFFVLSASDWLNETIYTVLFIKPCSKI